MIQTMQEVGAVGGGANRAVAFGGGGEWFVAWMLGYTQGLSSGGVDLADADVTVGTSAGAIVGAAIKGGSLDRLVGQFEGLGNDPAKANAMLHITEGAPSQKRAQNVMAGTTQITIESLQEIGRAAMAAHNDADSQYIASVNGLVGLASWPTGHHTTAVDCYTGEPVLVCEPDGVPIATAAAASSSLPGTNGPTWLGDRLCMDGGVSHSSTHATVLQGAKFVLIIGMFDFAANPPQQVNPSFGIAERTDPGTADREAAALRSSGSVVHVTIANPDPTIDFMDPATIDSGMADGRARGIQDAPLIAPHWASQAT